MYESYYGLTEKPFTLLPDPDYLYLSPKHLRALTLLEYGLMNQAGFSVICGDIGAGKTTLIRRLLTELGEDTTVGLITNTHQSFGDLLSWILMSFGIDSEGKNKAQMHQIFIEFLIGQYAKNLNTVLIVDEAQNMDANTLEELRMISNINSDKDQVLQVILAGQPGLRKTLRKPELMQFAQRISVDYYLESLSKEETSNYIKHRLKIAGANREIFSDGACEAIYRYSGGTPRLINLLCDTALVYGFAEQNEKINEKLIEDVVKEQHSNSIVPTFNKPLSDVDIEKLEKSQSSREVVESIEFEDKIIEEKESERERERERLAAGAGNISMKSSAGIGSIGVSEKAPIDSTVTSSVSHGNKENKSETSNITSIKQNEAASLSSEKSENVKIQTETSQLDDDDSQTNNIEEMTEEIEISEIMDDQADKEEAVTVNENFESDEEDKDFDNSEDGIERESLDEAFHDRRRPYSSSNSEVRDSYPLIHIKDNNKKDVKVLIFGFIGGLILASTISLGGAYYLFGGGQVNNVEHIESNNNDSSFRENVNEKLENDRIRLEAISKERDAALAITKSLERERDAALATAKAEESMRKVERRAAEILAQQERDSAEKLKRATERARIAELEAARAKENEHKAKLKAMQKSIEEKKAEKIQNDFSDPVPLMVEPAPVKPEIVRPVITQPAPVFSRAAVEPVKIEPVLIEKKVIKKTTKFSTNPCSSPSSKFLSTCKK